MQLLALEGSDASIAPVLHSLNAAVREGIVNILTALRNRGLVDVDRSLSDEAVYIHATIDGFSIHALTDVGLDTRERMYEVLSNKLTQLRCPAIA